jgi:uncharacterized protein (DUF58 family)
MSAWHNSAELLLKRLEWTVIRKLDGVLQGDYRTVFRGFGLDLADLREYQPHDDVRHIDWNVTARTQVPHVRVYNEDRDVTAWFLLDLSPSVDFGSNATSKRQVLTEFAAVVARLLTRRGNKVGAVLFDGINSFVVPPRGGRPQVLHMLERIELNPRLLHAPRTEITQLVAGALGAIKRRSLIFVVSDFIAQPGWERALSDLSRRHEVLAVRLVDPADGRLPDVGMLQLEDSETGETMFVDTGDRGFRRRYEAAAEQNETELLGAFMAAGTDVLELSTEDDLVDAIRRFADMRKPQRAFGAAPPQHVGTAEAGP